LRACSPSSASRARSCSAASGGLAAAALRRGGEERLGVVRPAEPLQQRAEPRVGERARGRRQAGAGEPLAVEPLGGGEVALLLLDGEHGGELGPRIGGRFRLRRRDGGGDSDGDDERDGVREQAKTRLGGVWVHGVHRTIGSARAGPATVKSRSRNLQGAAGRCGSSTSR
jgi:hypothetical protein